jgi:hypothetical protein
VGLQTLVLERAERLLSQLGSVHWKRFS